MREYNDLPLHKWKLILTLAVLSFAVPVLLIIGVVQLVMGGMRSGPGTPGMTPAAIESRIKPVGEINYTPSAPLAATPAAPVAASASAAPATAAARSGDQVYQAGCALCHGAGIAGAPKFADAAAWKPRIAQGKAVLYEHAIKGIRAMPAKGGNPALPDAEVKAAVDHMVKALK